MNRYLSPLETLLFEHMPTRIMLIYTLRGGVDGDLLAKAFYATLARYPVLRGRVGRDGAGYFLHPGDGELPRLRIRDRGANALHEELNTPLTPGGELVRVTLLRGDAEDTVALNVNHAFCDGRSAEALGNALWRSYTALAEARPLPAAEHVDYYSDPIETHLQHWSDAEVRNYITEQKTLCRELELATLPNTAGVQRAPGQAPTVDVQRLRLDQGDTEGILATAKVAGLGLHGLISGALISRLRRHLLPAIGPVMVGCMTAVDLRSRLHPPLPRDRMLMAVSWFTSVVEVTGNSHAIDLGRDYLNQLRAGIERGDPELSVRALPALLAERTGLLEGSLSVSNLGTFLAPPTPAGLEVTDIRVFGAPEKNVEKNGNGRLRVLVLTVAGRLSLELAYNCDYFSPKQVREFLDATGAALRSFSRGHPGLARCTDGR